MFPIISTSIPNPPILVLRTKQSSSTAFIQVCERSDGNAIFESQNLLHAARLFLEAEQLNHELLCPSYSEHLQAALSAYGDCVKVYLDSQQHALAAALLLEVGQSLKQLGRISQAISYFIRAAELHRSCALDYLNDLKEISDCRIRLGDYDGALTVLTEMQVIAEKRGVKENGERIGAFTSILNNVEISRILLLLLLKPPEFKLRPEHAKLLEQYSDIDRDPVDYIEDDLYLLLQSLMIAVKERDESALLHLERDLWPRLTPLQNDILSKILAQYRDYSVSLPYK
ncbi:40-kDa huntingtin-associated protein-like isoform X2 [Stegodyphus dumicola]|uniref:40-kDa huntingtin-associated protein-like isoform X2 n=1 Tax=Stegodyphus dumicola TaxID=202533 RepID=UPI0015AA190C|nr:40-kDa huntingtin-associated protein-like isoform X2 [Stegodyphus dumicola]XP_035208725.1 40-kDa huntingtin-associated protein-like isoform X2 [Stegodyphus dumicola]